MIVDFEQNFVGVGYHREGIDFDTFKDGLWPVKLNQSGRQISEKIIFANTNMYNYGSDIVQDPDGSYIIVGTTSKNISWNTSNDIWVVKVNDF